MTEPGGLVELVHRLVGYPTAFLVAPAALFAFSRPAVHRRAGAAYVGLMTFLYLSGTTLTLTRHDWTAWGFWRNLAFNFLGYLTVLLAWRAITLFRRPELPRPSTVDRILAGALAAGVTALVAVALVQDFPMRVFALAGVVLLATEIHDLRHRMEPRTLLFRRHLRYVLTSYFYVLTVVSLVHLQDELPREVKWLWPLPIALLAVSLATGGPVPFRRLAAGRGVRWAVILTLALALPLGAYALVELARGGVAGQSEARDQAGGMSGGAGSNGKLPP